MKPAFGGQIGAVEHGADEVGGIHYGIRVRKG